MATSVPSHSFVWASSRGITLEPCEDEHCRVDAHGRTTCGSIACPSCGRGGANLSIAQRVFVPGDEVACGCGYRWSPLRGDAAAAAPAG